MAIVTIAQSLPLRNIVSKNLLHHAHEQKQREFLNSIAHKYNIQKPSDWGGITSRTLYKEGADKIKAYKGSVIRLLRSVFPGNIQY